MVLNSLIAGLTKVIITDTHIDIAIVIVIVILINIITDMVTDIEK